MAPRRRCSRSIITPERPNFEQVPIFLSARWERGSVAHRDSSRWVGEWERGTPISHKVAKSGARPRYAFLPHRATMSHVLREYPSLYRSPPRRGQFSFWRDLSGWNIERNLAAHYSSGFITPPPARRLNLHRCSKDRRKRPDEKLARADGRSFRRSLARLVSDPRSAAPRPTTDRPTVAALRRGGVGASSPKWMEEKCYDLYIPFKIAKGCPRGKGRSLCSRLYAQMF